MNSSWLKRLRLTLAPGALLLAASSVSHAAEFHLFLQCKGHIKVNGATRPATVDFALRDNNNTALIQRSNVLPVGERLKYTQTPVLYTMLYKLPQPGTVVYQDWMSGQLIVWQPNLKRLATIRMAIDRQTGELDAELLDFDDVLLGTLNMACQRRDTEDGPEPKF